MKKRYINYLVDTLLFTLLGGIAIIGILLGCAIPKGSAAPGESKYLRGIHRHDWDDIHLYMSFVLLALILVHIALHWSWAAIMTKRVFRQEWLLYPVILLALTIGTPIALWSTRLGEPNKYEREEEATGKRWRGGAGATPPKGAHSGGRKTHDKPRTHGYMNLAEGELGFDIEEVREIAAEHK